MANVLITNAIPEDDLVKIIYNESLELQDGDVLALGTKSTTRPTNGAYATSTPAEGKTLVMVYNADVPTIYDAMGNGYKGITDDPRAKVFAKNTVVNAYMPEIGAEIVMTEITGSDTSATHVVYKAGSVKPQYATSTSGALIAFEITAKNSSPLVANVFQQLKCVE